MGKGIEWVGTNVEPKLHKMDLNKGGAFDLSLEAANDFVLGTTFGRMLPFKHMDGTTRDVPVRRLSMEQHEPTGLCVVSAKMTVNGIELSVLFSCDHIKLDVGPKVRFVYVIEEQEELVDADDPSESRNMGKDLS